MSEYKVSDEQFAEDKAAATSLGQFVLTVDRIRRLVIGYEERLDAAKAENAQILAERDGAVSIATQAGQELARLKAAQKEGGEWPA